MTSKQEITGRTARGQFAPGASGNPGGRPKTAARYRRLLCQQLTDKQFVGIVDKLLELANSGDVKAIRLCLEYSIGKPAQSEIDDNDASHDGLAARVLEMLEGATNGV